VINTIVVLVVALHSNHPLCINCFTATDIAVVGMISGRDSLVVGSYC
jgi:hypothetical protein